MATTEGVEHVNASILQIIGTQIGSRFFLRDFGCRIHELIFRPNDESLNRLIEYHVRDAIEKWERRVRVQQVYIDQQRAAEGVVEIGLRYILLARQSPESLVYPWYYDTPESRRLAGLA